MGRLRWQLMLLYALPFFASGLLLVSIPILQIRESSPAGTSVPPPGSDTSDPMMSNVRMSTTSGSNSPTVVVVSVCSGPPTSRPSTRTRSGEVGTPWAV